MHPGLVKRRRSTLVQSCCLYTGLKSTRRFRGLWSDDAADETGERDWEAVILSNDDYQLSDGRRKGLSLPVE